MEDVVVSLLERGIPAAAGGPWAGTFLMTVDPRPSISTVDLVRRSRPSASFGKMRAGVGKLTHEIWFPFVNIRRFIH